MGATLARREEVRLLAEGSFPLQDRAERPEPSEELCAVCLSELSRARCFQLDCGHKYHSLCLASSFQIQQLCPLCRAGVSDATCTEVARSLFVGAGPHGARFAAELLTELGARQRTVDAELSSEETISAIQRAAKTGDDSKIPMIAALLQPEESGFSGDTQVELRLVAVQALRNLVPAFPGGWPGWQAVRGLLQKVALEDVAVEELRLCSIQALKEVSRRDAHDEALSVAFNILQDTTAGRELRLAAGSILQAIAVPNDVEVELPCSLWMNATVVPCGHMRFRPSAPAQGHGAHRHGSLRSWLGWQLEASGQRHALKP